MCRTQSTVEHSAEQPLKNDTKKKGLPAITKLWYLGPLMISDAAAKKKKRKKERK